MKHLKRIDEFFGGEYNQEFIKELQDISNMYLSYLIDEGFDVVARIRDGGYSILISKRIEDKGSIFTINSYEKFFKYNDIKDSFIPFVEYLNKEYGINDVFFLGDWAKKGWFDKMSDKIKGTISRSRMRLEVEPGKVISDRIRLKFDPISVSINGIYKK